MMNRSRFPRLLVALATLSSPAIAQGGAFAPAVRVPVGDFPAELAVGDLDGDGLLDVVSANVLDGSVSALQGTGTASFGSMRPYGVGVRSRDVTAADLDGDGDADVVALDDVSGSLRVFLSDGAGTLVPSGLFAAALGAANPPTAIECGDMDGDGDLDLLVLVSGPLGQASELYRLDNQGGGAGGAWLGFASPMPLPVAVQGKFLSGVSDLAVADFTGDGAADVALAHEGFFFLSPGSNVYTFAGDGAGNIAGGVAQYVGSSAGPTRISLADADGDGDLDLASANRFSGDVCVLRNEGLGAGGRWQGFTNWFNGMPYTVQFTAASATDVAWLPRDLNGDGVLDLVVAESTRNRIGVLYSDAARGFLFGGHVPVGLSPLALAVANDAVVAVASGDDEVAVVSLDELPVAAAGGGNVGIAGGGPFELLRIDGSAGGDARTVSVARGQSFTLSVDYPATNASGRAPFALWGRLGTPSPSDFFYAGGVGALSFAPCPLGAGFTLLDNVGLGTCAAALPSAPLRAGQSWSFTFPNGLGAPVEVTLQGVVFGLENTLQVTNAVVLEVR